MTLRTHAGAAAITARTFLIKGLIAGLIAGIAAFGTAYIVGEPSIDAAIAIEESGSAAEDLGHDHGAADAHAHGAEEAGHSHGEDAEVSRETQSTWGLATATIVVGLALGGIVGLACAFAVGRFGRLSPRATVASVVGIGFVSFYLVPFFKYPPNPPAVGDGETIGTRTAQYAAMVAISVIAAIVAVVAARKTAAKVSGMTATLLAGLGYGIVVLVAGLLLAPIDEVPDSFPAELLYEFRMGSLAVQATLWLVLGLVLAGSVHLLYQRVAAAQERRSFARSL